MKSIAKLLAMSVVLFSQSSWAAKGMEDLLVYKSSGVGHGLWRVELLSSSEAAMNQGASALGKMSICTDVAKQMSQNNQLDEQKCTPKVLRNTKDVAEIDVTCSDGMHSHVTVNRENDQSYVLDTQMTSKEGKTRTVKARYSYEGTCKNDSVIQLDKNSEACKKMSNVDTTKLAQMCANAPEQYRAQCEQQMKQMDGTCK